MASSNVTRQPSLWWIDAAGIVVCLLASAVGYATLVRPFLQKRAADAALVREIETRQKAVAGLESAAEAARDRVTMAREQLTAGALELESAVHINKRMAGVTEFFSSCALHVDDMQTGRVSNGPQYDLVPIAIVGWGAYPQCVKLLHGLCVKYPDMSVMRIDLAGNRGHARRCRSSASSCSGTRPRAAGCRRQPTRPPATIRCRSLKDRLMNLTKRQQRLLTVVIVSAVGLVMDRTILRPQGGPQAASADATAAAMDAPAAGGAPDQNTPARPPLAERLSNLLAGAPSGPNDVRDPFCLPATWSETAAASAERAPDAVRGFLGKHRLKAVLIQGGVSCAQVDDSYLRPGQYLDGFKLISVDQRSAVFERQGKQAVLELAVE